MTLHSIGYCAMDDVRTVYLIIAKHVNYRASTPLIVALIDQGLSRHCQRRAQRRCAAIDQTRVIAIAIGIQVPIEMTIPTETTVLTIHTGPPTMLQFACVMSSSLLLRPIAMAETQARLAKEEETT